MSRKVFENDRHRVTRQKANGFFDQIANSIIGLKDPVKISVFDKKTKRFGHGIAKDSRDAENKAWRDLRSKNNR